MPLNPAFFASSKVAPTTGGLFQLPSVSTASSVLPRFHPGLILSKKLPAEMAVNFEVLGHVTPVPFVAGKCQCVNSEVLKLCLSKRTLSSSKSAIKQQCCSRVRNPHGCFQVPRGTWCFARLDNTGIKQDIHLRPLSGYVARSPRYKDTPYNAITCSSPSARTLVT
jgi:hypothetical protein